MPWCGTAMPGATQRNRARDAAVLAIARMCHQTGKRFPPRKRLAEQLECPTPSLWRTLKRLEQEGALVLRQEKVRVPGRAGAWVRFRVERVA